MVIENRIEELESRLAYVDDTVEQLNDVISKQQRQIDQLELMLKKLASDYHQMKDSITPEIIDSKPPHY